MRVVNVQEWVAEQPYQGTSASYGNEAIARQTGKRSRGKERVNKRAPRGLYGGTRAGRVRSSGSLPTQPAPKRHLAGSDHRYRA